MKIAALKRFRAKLRDGDPVYGLWVTLESATVTELAASLGLDWVVIDAEHGHLDWKEINEHIRGAVRSDTIVLVRLAERSTSLAKRALDIGADGIVVPQVETVAEVLEMLSDCRYPPEGRRGIGAERATVWGQCFVEHASEANEHVLVVPLIESVAATPNIAEMSRLDGIDFFFFGPADFSASAGYRGEWEGPGVAESILQLKEQIKSAGKHCGLVTRSAEDLVNRQREGFQVLGLGSDAGLVVQSIHGALRAVRSDRLPAASLNPADIQVVRHPLPHPPEEMRSNRQEIITEMARSEACELQAGVSLKTLVGPFYGAENLTTGIVSMDPEAVLDCHTHPCSESITVLEGVAEVTVEGRVYQLGPLDNIAIPRWTPHAARNSSPSDACKLHVALASGDPQRDLVEHAFERTEMDEASTGMPGCERVSRFATAARSFGVGDGAEFVDYFNSKLVPGIEMSGGFGRFKPGGRLPAHLHDFDESICIIDGTATCLVEGTQYALRDCSTAMVPRGRVHYFLNETSDTMDMIWVYAGPMPERIVVDERCALHSEAIWGPHE